MKNINLILTLFVSTFLLQSCLHDVRPRMLKREGISEENTLKGKQILDRVWKKQGGDKLEERKVYSFQGIDTWKKSRLGKIGKLWSDYKTTLVFQFSGFMIQIIMKSKMAKLNFKTKQPSRIAEQYLVCPIFNTSSNYSVAFDMRLSLVMQEVKSSMINNTIWFFAPGEKRNLI